MLSWCAESRGLTSCCRAWISSVAWDITALENADTVLASDLPGGLQRSDRIFEAGRLRIGRDGTNFGQLLLHPDFERREKISGGNCCEIRQAIRKSARRK